MRESTENFFKIKNQPINFCSIIDPVLKGFKDFESESEENYISLKENNSVGDDILSLEELSLSGSEHETLSETVDEMLEWFSGWLLLLEKAIDKEKLEDYKNDLIEKFMYFNEQKNYFDREFNSVLIEIEKYYSKLEVSEYHFNKIVNSYNENTSDFNEVTEENIDFINDKESDLSSEFNDIENDLESLIGAYEDLRVLASDLRTLLNENLKELTKIQMTRISEEKWIFFLDFYLSENQKNYYKNNSKLVDFNFY